MRCIFCLEQHPAGDEHVFPLAIGGTLHTDRVCTDCNSYLGAKVDVTLVNHLLVALWRSRLGLPGNSGHIPDGLALLVADGVTLVDNPDLRVKGVVNPETGQLEAQVLHSPSHVPRSDGALERRISIDAKDIGQIPKIVQRERKRTGLPPASSDELAQILEAARRSVQTIETPRLRGRRKIDFADVWIAFLKIAYELAFLWLGESYLDDELGEVLRDVVIGRAKRNDRVRVAIRLGTDHHIPRIWPDNAHCHVAHSSVINRNLVISVKVFDICANVVVSDRAELYGMTEGNARLVHVDPVKRTLREALFVEELHKIAVANSHPGA
jgi:hypothetical protein